jgi:hypothetical protein
MDFDQHCSKGSVDRRYAAALVTRYTWLPASRSKGCISRCDKEADSGIHRWSHDACGRGVYVWLAIASKSSCLDFGTAATTIFTSSHCSSGSSHNGLLHGAVFITLYPVFVSMHIFLIRYYVAFYSLTSFCILYWSLLLLTSNNLGLWNNCVMNLRIVILS